MKFFNEFNAEWINERNFSGFRWKIRSASIYVSLETINILVVE